MTVEEWFAERIPPRWGARAIEVLSDSDEILVIVDLGGRRGAGAERAAATNAASLIRLRDPLSSRRYISP